MPMIKKIFFIGGAIFILIFIAFSMKTGNSDDSKMLKVESVPFHNSSGWGYEILVDHKIFIHQENIPALTGKKSFVTKEDAMKIATLVVQKLVRGKQPSITKDDLTALKISYQ
jgi:hypothetical protein